MHAGADSVCDGRLHRRKIAAEPPIGIRAPNFEVDIHRIDVRQETRERLRTDHAVRDEHDLHPRRVQDRGRIHDVLIADERLVVGKGDADVAARLTAQILGESGKLRRHDVLRLNMLVCHCNACILTEGAREVAAEAADREDEALGVKVIQGLLLNRVERKRGEPSVIDGADLTADVRACTAKACLARTQTAGMGTERAGDACIWFSVQRCRLCVCGIRPVGERGVHLRYAARP